jgi:hypothetical protein
VLAAPAASIGARVVMFEVVLGCGRHQALQALLRQPRALVAADWDPAVAGTAAAGRSAARRQPVGDPAEAAAEGASLGNRTTVRHHLQAGAPGGHATHAGARLVASPGHSRVPTTYPSRLLQPGTDVAALAHKPNFLRLCSELLSVLKAPIAHRTHITARHSIQA